MPRLDDFTCILLAAQDCHNVSLTKLWNKSFIDRAWSVDKGWQLKISQSGNSIASPIYSKYWTGHWAEWFHAIFLQFFSPNNSLILGTVRLKYRTLVFSVVPSVVPRAQSDISPNMPKTCIYILPSCSVNTSCRCGKMASLASHTRGIIRVV